MIPPFGPNPTDPSLVYAWPTRRLMRAADCRKAHGVYLDPDAADEADPGLAAAIAASLKDEPAATAPRPEVVPTDAPPPASPAGGTAAAPDDPEWLVGKKAFQAAQAAQGAPGAPAGATANNPTPSGAQAVPGRPGGPGGDSDRTPRP